MVALPPVNNPNALCIGGSVGPGTGIDGFGLIQFIIILCM